MKKEEIKKILKYVVIAILIVSFFVRTVFVTSNYIEDKIRLGYLYEDKVQNIEYVEYLRWLEEWLVKGTEEVKDALGEDYPATGAMIEQTNILNGVYEMQEFVICIISGTVIGMACYIMKKDYKKLIHYVAIHILFFTILILLMLTIGSLGEFGSAFGSLTFGSINIVDLLEMTGITIIPYTVIYILICLIIHLINKKRIESLNECIK